MDKVILTNRVQQPKERENSSGYGIRPFEFGPNGTRRRPSWANEDPPNVEEGEVSKHVEAPFVWMTSSVPDQNKGNDEIAE